MMPQPAYPARNYAPHTKERERKTKQLAATLRQYARLERVPLALARTDCREALEHAVAQLAAEIDGREARIRISAFPWLTVDAARISLLFYHLLSHALLHSDDPPAIEVSARPAHDAWLFAVRDHGRPRPTGSMELAMARKIVELHGGRFWTEENGRDCYFTLPA